MTRRAKRTPAKGAAVTVHLSPAELRALDYYRGKGERRASVLRRALRALDGELDGVLMSSGGRR